MANKKQVKAVPEKQTGNGKKKWTKKRIVAASIIGAAMVAFVVFGVIVLTMGVRPIKSEEAEAMVVGSYGNYDVRYEELRYVTLLHKQSLDAEMGEHETLDATAKAVYAAELENRVMKDLKSNYVILSMCDEYGIDSNSRDVRTYVQNSIEEYVNKTFSGDVAKYKEWLEENHLTDHFLRLLYKVDYLEAQLLSYFVENHVDVQYGEENITEFVSYVMRGEDWVRAIHAYYPKGDDSASESGFAQATAAAAELAGVEDAEARYDAMCSIIGKAPFVSGYSIVGSGIYFTYGQMGEAYESAGFALSEYECSGVIETEDGYYVIMRLPAEEDYVKKNAADLLNKYQYAVLKKYEDSCRESLVFEAEDCFADISLADMK